MALSNETVQSTEKATLPKTGRCHIGSLGLHTFNYERDECIWCGPNGLAWKPGHWEAIDGGRAWSATPPFIPESIR